MAWLDMLSFYVCGLVLVSAKRSLLFLSSPRSALFLCSFPVDNQVLFSQKHNRGPFAFFFCSFRTTGYRARAHHWPDWKPYVPKEKR